MSKKVAIIEDEADIRELLRLHLERSGYEISLYPSGDDFLSKKKGNSFDLVILDIMLPGMDGLDVLKYLRSDEKTKEIPVIMLTAKGTEVDIVVGLELGADDYITKPFSTRELLARIKVIFRRLERSESDKIIRFGDVEIYPEKVQVKVHGNDIELTATEFNILKTLVQKKGRVFTRTQILDLLGEDRQFVLDRTVDVHILNIRKKLSTYGKNIQTIRGIGYKITEE